MTIKNFFCSKDRHGIWASLLFVCAVLAYAVSAMKDRVPEETVQPEASVSASRLLKEYSANEAAAEIAWRDRIIAVDDTVDRIGVSFGDPYIVLSGIGLLDGVRCNMDKSSMNEAAHLREGQPVTVKGKVGGLVLGSVFLKDCRVVRDASVLEGQSIRNAQEISSVQAVRHAEKPCARISSWDAWFGATKDFRTEHPECRPDTDVLQAPSISADRLATEYRENEVAAEENYKDRVLVVTGAVQSIETDMDGKPRIWLETEIGRGVLCSLAMSERRKAAALRRDQTVSLVGLIGVSIMRTPTMDEAVLLDEEQPSSGRSTTENAKLYLQRQKKDCAEVLELKAVEGGAAAEVMCSRRRGDKVRYLLVIRECRLGSRGDVKELKK